MPSRVTPRCFRAGLACAAVVGITLLPGCRKAEEAVAERAIEQATGQEADVKRDGETMTINAGDAEIKVATAENGGSVALPADFPRDVFLPAPRRVNSAMDMGGLKMVNLTTPAAPAAVAAHVEQAMQAQGWKRQMAMQADGSSTLIFTKDQRQAAYQLARADGSGTHVAVRTGSD